MSSKIISGLEEPIQYKPSKTPTIGNVTVGRFSEKNAKPLLKPWHRNALIAVAIAGLLIVGASLAIHLGYLPELHHFSASSYAHHPRPLL